MPPRPTQQQQAPKQDRDPSEPVFNPAAGSDFDTRFNAAFEKDEAARQADQAKRLGHIPQQPAQEPVKEQPKPEAEVQPKAEAQPESEKPKTDQPASEQPEQPKQPEKPTAVPDLKRQKTAAENFAELRKRTEAAEAEVKRLTQLAQSQKPAVDNSELERLKKENDELQERLAITDITMSPKFQAHYEGQIAPALKEARDIVGPERGDQIQTILEMPQSVQRTKLLADVLEELEPWQKLRLGQIDNRISALAMERSVWLGRARETRDQIIAKQQQQEQQAAAAAAAMFSEQMKRAENPDTGFYGFISTDKNAEEVARNRSLAEAIFTRNLSTEDLAKAAIWAAAAPAFLKELADREAEVASLKESIQKLKAAGPSPGSGPSAETPQSEKEDENMSYAERVSRRAARSGAFER